jgi:glycerate 2-kinase
MTAAAVDRFGSAIRAGLVIAPTRAEVPEGLQCVVGGHPMPNAESERAGREARALAESLSADDVLVVLLSGGASALMVMPAEGVTLDDKRATTDRLLRAGADIHALNTVRKHLSAIKGGWLAARARASTITLAISDVVGDELSVIASGPTVADATTFQEALDVLRRFGGEDHFPPAVLARFRRGIEGAIAETPKPGDARLARAMSRVIGSRRDAMIGAAAEAEARGYHVVQVDDPVVGEARTAAATHLRACFARAATVDRPACIVSSGETTVHVTGRGKGGRNQEFALAAVVGPGLRTVPVRGTGLPTDVVTGTGPETTAAPPSPIALASIGTDGIDGPTDAAGAIADSTTLERARAAGLDPDLFLSDNNAFAFFDALGDLIHTGATGTNVGDLQVILLA